MVLKIGYSLVTFKKIDTFLYVFIFLDELDQLRQSVFLSFVGVHQSAEQMASHGLLSLVAILRKL
jgi:hypothetical protein